MDRVKSALPVLLTVGGLILLLLDMAHLKINMRGADSIAGAILLGFGVMALTQKQK